MNLSKGIDLRRCNLDLVTNIFLEGISFPPGELEVYWDQLKGLKNPRIQLSHYSKNHIDDYRKIDNIYKLLYNNFVAQGNNSSADEVKYELAWQKDLLLNNFLQRLYGLFMGYGYKPYLLLYLIVPIIFIFAIIWYFFYYPFIFLIINSNFTTELDCKKMNFPFKNNNIVKKYTLKYYDHINIKPSINIFTKICHTLCFSSSVFLSIRFKKEWLHSHTKPYPYQNSFLKVLTFEWTLGLLLLIIFAIYVKGSYFTTIKGLFGF
jgi:hypothetical protein